MVNIDFWFSVGNDDHAMKGTQKEVVIGQMVSFLSHCGMWMKQRGKPTPGSKSGRVTRQVTKGVRTQGSPGLESL